jgi:hypothetical protein
MATVSSDIPARSHRGFGAAVYDSIADIGVVAMRWVQSLGDMSLFFWRTLAWLFSRMPRRIR